MWVVAKAERVNGAIYATAGDASDGEKFMSWIKRGRRGKRPAVAEGFDALALTKEGLFLYDQALYPMKLLNSHAIGSGGKACRAALIMGATLQRAVEVACEVDAGSRMPLQIYSLDDIDEKKEK